MRRVIPGLLALLVLLPVGAAAQQVVQDDDWCDSSRSRRDDRARVCEVREYRLGSRSEVTVDAGTNGGIEVRAWDRDEVVLRARVQSWARHADDARSLADEVTIDTGRRIEADGPNGWGSREGWAVSYRVFVPRSIDLDLEAHNGGIDIDGVRGRLRLETVNGGLDLVRVSGDVRGRTTNGGLDVELAGDTWDGAGLDLQTTNGGIDVHMPDGYSARLVTGTVNGHLEIDFPIMVQGRISRRIETQLGQGGPTLRLITTNGGVSITR